MDCDYPYAGNESVSLVGIADVFVVGFVGEAAVSGLDHPWDDFYSASKRRKVENMQGDLRIDFHDGTVRSIFMQIVLKDVLYISLL